MNLDMLKALGGVLARKALTISGTFLVTAGLATDTQANEAEGAALVLGAFLWSVLQQYRANKALKIAKLMPAEPLTGGV